jgi:hypothetical protein
LELLEKGREALDADGTAAIAQEELAHGAGEEGDCAHRGRREDSDAGGARESRDGRQYKTGWRGRAARYEEVRNGKDRRSRTSSADGEVRNSGFHFRNSQQKVASSLEVTLHRHEWIGTREKTKVRRAVLQVERRQGIAKARYVQEEKEGGPVRREASAPLSSEHTGREKAYV